jgi:magnesium chelatase family protein
VSRYKNKLSGPLLDRIDLHVDLQATQATDLFSTTGGEPSATVRVRVRMAKDFQERRGQSIPNAHLSSVDLQKSCRTQPQAMCFLKESMEQLNLSARAALRVLGVARTIADLCGEEQVTVKHLAEAIGFRAPPIPV